MVANFLLFLITVDEGAVVDVQFEGFYHTPPDGFDSILIEKSLLWKSIVKILCFEDIKGEGTKNCGRC